jgi:regulator of protease activity HflC (stomatin/prohibitin superfamily)
MSAEKLSRAQTVKFAAVAVPAALAGAFLAGAVLFSTTVAPGYEAVINRSPLVFGEQGILAQPLTAGRQFLAPTTTVVSVVDMRPSQANEQFSDVISNDNVPVSFSAYLTLQVRTGQSPAMVRDFGNTLNAVYQQNIQEQFRTIVRREAERYTMTALTTGKADGADGNVMDAIAVKVQKQVEELVRNRKLPLEVVSVNIGKATPPREVIDAIARTAAEQQRRKTENETAEAEKARAVAEGERAKADNTYRTAMGLSPSEFVDLEKAKVCARASGCTLILGGAAVPEVAVARKPQP